jgi:hypothetical protein
MFLPEAGDISMACVLPRKGDKPHLGFAPPLGLEGEASGLARPGWKISFVDPELLRKLTSPYLGIRRAVWHWKTSACAVSKLVQCQKTVRQVKGERRHSPETARPRSRDHIHLP